MPPPLSDQPSDVRAITGGVADRGWRPRNEGSIAAYMALLEDADPTVDTLLRAGFEADQVPDLLSSLAEMGLVSVDADRTIDVPPPNTTIPTLAAELESQARDSMAAMHGLTQLYHRVRTPDQEQRLDLTVLSNFDDLSKARHQLAGTAQREAVRACARSSEMDQSLINQAAALTTDSAPRVASRLIVDLSFLEVDGAMEALTAIADHGVEVRLTPQVVCNLAVVDGTIALIDLTNFDPTGFGSVVVRHPPLVQVIKRLLEKAFQSGLQLPRGHETDVRLLGSRDTRILALLAAGASDSTIARQLAVSHRTVERRVRAILDTLGSTTRFQAGVVAAREGLI